MRRIRSAKLIALSLSFGLIAAACADDKEGAAPNTGVGCTAVEAPAPKAQDLLAKTEPRSPGGTLRYGADQEPPGFNELTGKDNGTAVKNVTENLLFYGVKAKPDFTVEYTGFEGEPQIVSEEGEPQTVEWKIKEEAVWSDGTPITSDDIEYHFQQLTNPDNDVASTTGVEQITKFEKIDPKTFQATFEPDYTDYKLLWYAVAQKKYMSEQPGGWNTGLDTNPGPSAGPYLFESYNPGKDLTLVRNPRWWGETKPTLDKIIFIFIEDSTAQVDALTNNELDFIYPQPQTEIVDKVAQLPDVTTQVNFGPQYEHITFNLQNEILKDVKVRKAIAHSVDRGALVKTLMKEFSESASCLDNHIYVRNQKQYVGNGDAYRDVNLEKAGVLLDEAGWLLPEGKTIREKNGKKLTLRVSTTADNKLREDQAELIKNQLTKAGFDIKIENTDPDTFFGKWLPAGNFDLGIWAWVGSVNPETASFQVWAKGSESNYGKYSNKEYEALGDKINANPSPEDLTKYGNELDKILWDDMVSLPLYQKPTFLAVRSTFVNINDNSTNEGPFWNAETFGLAKE